MKTMQAGAVVLLGMVLAAPAWGQVAFIVDPNDPLRCEIGLSLSGIPDTVGIPRNTWRLHAKRYISKGYGWDHRAIHFLGSGYGRNRSHRYQSDVFLWEVRLGHEVRNEPGVKSFWDARGRLRNTTGT